MFEVHPIAALFPMLPADELKDLAADIAQRGLLDPIVVDSASAVLDDDGHVIDGCILDGRNRYAACGMAGVTPQFLTYHGDDLDGFVLAANIARRHMNKGQRAMVIAQACLVSKQPQREAGAQHGISAARIAQASTVIKHAPDQVGPVVSGALSLDAAYADAKARKELAQLWDGAPDLADDTYPMHLGGSVGTPKPSTSAPTASDVFAAKFYKALSPLMEHALELDVLTQHKEFGAHVDQVCREHRESVVWAQEIIARVLERLRTDQEDGACHER
jgi:hypothetical protein